MCIPRPLLSFLALSGFLLSPSQAQGMVYRLGDEATTAGDFGRSVADAGDIDFDGVPDLLVGSPFHNPGGGIGGAVFIYSGKTGQLIWSRNSEFNGDAFGWSVDGIGDITGDGRSEIIVSAPLYDNDDTGFSGGGKVYVFSPATDSIVMSLWSDSFNTQIGLAVKGLGDITGDGVPDFAFGAPKFDNAGLIDCGAVFAYSGASLTSAWVEFGSKFGAALGYSIDVLHNTGNAAQARVAVGAPQYDANGGNARGQVVILNGLGNVISSLVGATNDSWFGYAIAGLGDVNGDGVYDFAVSTPFANILGVGNQAGFVTAYSGSNQNVLWTRTGTHAFANFGQALAGVGDVSGDGIPDVLIGSPNHEPTGTSGQGEARIASGVNGLTIVSYVGGLNDEMGRGVSVAGDLNQDGHIDYIIGADEAPFGAGEAYVHLSQADEPTVYCTAKVNSQGCTPQMSFEGLPSISIADNFHLNATQVINQKPGLMLWGRVAAATPFQGGLLCVGPPIVRTTVQSSAGNLGAPDCSGSYSYHFTQAYMSSQSIAPGDDIYAQYWSRDTASTFGVGLTDAVHFTVNP